MRFNPDTERAINIDEIAAQCKAAINSSSVKYDTVPYSEVRKFYRYDDTKVFRMKDYGSLITA